VKDYTGNLKMEELGQQHQIRQFYRDINTLRKDFKPRLTICKSKKGDIITEKDGILNRWKQCHMALKRHFYLLRIMAVHMYNCIHHEDLMK
jgi:hypothetical protein